MPRFLAPSLVLCCVVVLKSKSMAWYFERLHFPDGGLKPEVMESEVIEPRFVFLESSLLHPPNIEIAHMGVRVVQPTVRVSYFKTRMCFSARI